MFRLSFVCAFIFLFCGRLDAATWSVYLSGQQHAEEAIKVSLDDLKQVGQDCALDFSVEPDAQLQKFPAVVVGDKSRNKITAELISKGLLDLKPIDNAEGYEITTLNLTGGKVIVVSGGGLMGDVYGLYWLLDRMRVTGTLPEINMVRKPALEYRYTRVPVKNKKDIRNALRYGLNTVYGDDPLNLIPWDAEPEKSENQKHRADTKELAEYAHALHMNFLSFGTDFTYHPSLLEEFGATLTPSDPRFWDAVQAKYRRLLQSNPYLDGVATFTGEEQRYWGNYRTFDMIHDGEGCDWSLQKRYRMFVTKVADVVVGEFDKLHFHRTWITNAFEQQSQAAVYKKIFTDEVPIRNLFLIPSFTQNDRWWHQVYNPTINQTPHNMMVVFEQMDYHAGGNVFPVFPGQYFQGGLKTYMEVENPNLKGASLDLPSNSGWDSRCMTAYTVSRLEWDINEDVRQIAEDFAAIHFGQKAAKGMASLFLLSPVAYKYGLYIEPVAYGEFNSLPHIRVGMFVAEGYPRIDHGREHLEFLRKIYLRCKPWETETLMYLDHGLSTIESMLEQYKDIRPLITDTKSAEDVGTSLDMTRHLIRTNNLYVKLMFAYFDYREQRSDKCKAKLAALASDLKGTRDAFTQIPGFRYQLFGVDQLLQNATEAIEDLDQAEKVVANAPTSEVIEQVVAEQQKKYAELLSQYENDAVKILHWEGRVDGRDIIKIHGDKLEIEHLRWDGMYFKDYEILNPLPNKAVTVIPKDLESRPMHPFILEQPSKQNDYTVQVYLNDIPGGAGWCKFDLYFIPHTPDELGLTIDWSK